jgi:FMN phosphatase YigB (HAD superfamily)
MKVACRPPGCTLATGAPCRPLYRDPDYDYHYGYHDRVHPHRESATMPPAGSDPPHIALLSCDVFDTMLVRVVGAPSAVFLILGKRLAAGGLIRCSAEAFARARIEANRRARRNAGRGVGLGDIYHELQFSMDLSDAEREAIRAEELTLETELLRPVPGAADRLAEARAAGQAVAFLSDMYLDSAFLRGQLERHGLLAEGDGCYVSCEAGCGKEDGRAYRAMAEREGVPPGSVLHRGNDPRSDVAGARAAGVGAEPFLEGNLNRFEEALEAHTYATQGLSSVMAGAARLARLSVPASSAREAALRDVAASVGGPTLVSYMLWLLTRARRLGIRRLYFLAPDGHFLVRVVEALVRKLGAECDARVIPGVMQPDEAAENRQEVLSYIHQEGLLADSDWAVVDAGWSGRRIDAMSRALRAGGGEIPARFVFARFANSGVDWGGESVPVHAYFSDHPLRRGHRGRFNEVYLKLFCGAVHGEGALVIDKAILSFVDWLWLDPHTLDLEADMRPAVADALHAFFESPSAAEARAWGAYPGQDGDSAEARAPTASPLGVRDLLRALRHGQIRPPGNLEWPEGSLALTPPVTRALLKTGLAARRRLTSAGRRLKGKVFQS